MRRLFIAGNWKMNNTLAQACALVEGVRGALPREPSVDVAVCPPFTLLVPIGQQLAGTCIKLGAQDVYFEPKGAFTGEISAEMLKDAGCTYVIIGHSERRHKLGETDKVVSKKVRAALSGGMEVILCVGETLEQRHADQTEQVVAEQIDAAFGDDLADPLRITVAYEPVWAIGTGHNATPEQAQHAHEFIRSRLGAMYNKDVADRLRVQYGGSVNPSNAKGLLSQPDVDGALVGGASLNADDFTAIIQAAIKAKRSSG